MPAEPFDVSAKRIERLAPLSAETVMAEDGRARAAIVAPSGDAALRPAAEGLRSRLRDLLGVSLPIREPSEVLAKWPPEEHLIAVGVLGTNRLIEKLYFEYFTVMDHAFPGPGGFAVQTIHNPCGNGKNIIVLGGTEADPLRAGGERLCEAARVREGRAEVGHLTAVQTTAEGVPEATAAYLEEAKDLAGRLGEDFNNARMLLGRASNAALCYLMSGDPTHLETLKLYMAAHKGLGVPGMGTHMEMWRTIGYWDLVEESPAFTDAERLEIVNHFLSLLYSNEGVNYGFYRQGLKQKGVRHNHQTLPALCGLFGGRYFSRLYDWPDAKRWLKEAQTLFSTQALSFKPMCDAAGYQWFTLDTMATYALVSGDMAFFENGSCRRTCDLILMCMANRGEVPSFGDGGSWGVVPAPLLSAAAYVYRDGRYQRAMGDHKRPLGRGFVTEGIEVRGLEEFDGVHSFPMDPQFYRLAEDIGPVSGEANRGMKPGVPLEKAFDKVAFRGGTSPDGEFLLLDGITMGSHAHDDGNSILEFSALGKQFLVETTYTEGTNLQDHNATSIVYNGATGRPPGACSLEALANFPHVGFSATQMSGLSSADWRRHVVWRRGRFFVALDALVPKAAGRYRYQCFFRSLGEPKLDGDDFAVLQDDKAHREAGTTGPDAARFHIRGADAGVPSLIRDDREFGRYWARYAWADPVVNILSRTIRARRRAGQADWFINLLYAHPASVERDIRVRRVGEAWTLLREGEARTLIGVSLKPGEEQKVGTIRTDARMLFVDGERLALVEGRTAQVGALRVTASAPVSLEWSYAGEVVVEAQRPARITVEDGKAEHTFGAPAGRSERALPRTDAGPVRRELKRLGGLPDYAPRATDAPDLALRRAPGLKVRELFRGEAPLTDARALRVGGEVTLAVGTAGGEALAFSEEGSERWRHRTGGLVHSVAVSDVDRDGQAEVVAGSDDARTYLFGGDGKVRWAYQAPPYFGYWSHYASHCESRRVAAADLDGDGREEVLAAVGNLKLYVLSSDGEVRWTHEHYGTPTMFAMADVNGDGQMEVMAGTGDFGCDSNCFVLSPSGEVIRNLRNDGWSSKLTAIAAAPLQPDEPPAILFGTSKYGVIAWRFRGGEPERLWRAEFGDFISAVAVLPLRRPDRDAAVIVGSASDYVSGLTADGRKVWTRYLGSIPAAIASVQMGDEVLVGTSDGCLCRFEGRKGRIRGQARLPGPVTAVEVLKRGDGAVAFVAAGRALVALTL